MNLLDSFLNGPLNGFKSYLGAGIMAGGAIVAWAFPTHADIAPLAALAHQLGFALLGVGVAHKIAKLGPPSGPFAAA